MAKSFVVAVRGTVQRITSIRQGGKEIGVVWEYGPTIGLNPEHVVSQEPFVWSNDGLEVPEGTQKGSIKGLMVKTVLGDTFYLDTLTYL